MNSLQFFADEYIKEWWKDNISHNDAYYYYRRYHPFIRRNNILIPIVPNRKHKYKDFKLEIPFITYPTPEIYKMICEDSNFTFKHVEWREDGSVFNPRTKENYPPLRKEYRGRLCIRIPNCILAMEG